MEDNFEKFHTNLKFNHNKTRLIDEYGFEFPHDYPLINTCDVNNVGEGIFGEEKGKFISDTWINYYDIVKEKYSRRIKRFKNILNDTKPLIILCRYSINDILKIQNLFINNYNKDNIFFINSTGEQNEIGNIKNINTEVNGIWNDAKIWKENIDEIVLINNL